MKIVVLDGYTLNPGDLTWDGFERLGELVVYDRTAYDLSSKELVIERGKDADIILLNKTLLNREMMDEMPRLKYVGVLATGFNIVDVAAAREKGITVTNIPTYGTNAVAQMAIALLLELCHHAGSHGEAVANGEWETNPDWSFWKYPLIELAGKTIGIIGYGRIGRTVGEIAKALGMKVVAMANTPDLSLEGDMMHYGDLEDVLRESDVISLHCPLTETTAGIINKDTISRMKDGVMIINNSRGQLIVEEDLRDALNSGKVAGAALDVVSSEPIKSDNPLLEAKNCIITPHISWAPKEARTRLMDLALENLKRYLSGDPINVVNK